MSKPEQDLEALRLKIMKVFAAHMNWGGGVDDIVRLVQAEVAAARIDELRKYDMQHTGGQRSHKEYVNDRMAELHPPQQPPTEGGSE